MFPLLILHVVLGAVVVALLGYWLLRLGVSFGGWTGPGRLHFPLEQLS